LQTPDLRKAWATAACSAIKGLKFVQMRNRLRLMPVLDALFG
jgi:hypothetical protein